MARWKAPPKAKVYEAFSAVVAGRVTLVSELEAEVTSSAGDKGYCIEWDESLSEIASNDNASYWQGYLGYPIIAVLLAKGMVSYDEDTIRPLADVNWNRINKEFKRDYDKAVESVLREVEQHGGDVERIRRLAESVHAQLVEMPLQRGTSKKAPPKGG